MNKNSICAIITTFNRKNKLIECIQSIINQTYKPDCLLIIDNFSTDGTEKLISEIENEIRKSIKLIYKRLSENTGGAGGFHYGIKEAYEQGFEFFWVMDDDGKPDKNCLEKLIQYKDKADIIGPLVLNPDNVEELTFGIGKNFSFQNLKRILKQPKQSYKTVKEIKQDNPEGIVYNSANLFNGILISRKVVEKISLPMKELFIWGDETEYLFRALKNNIKVITVIDALFYHPKRKEEEITKLFGKYVIFEKVSKLQKYCYFRNMAYIGKKYSLPFFIRHFFKYTLFYIFNIRFSDFLFFLSSTIDGFLERWGKEKRYLKS